MTTVLILAISCIVTGIAIKVFLHRRAFYRRNDSGIEEFKSYSRMMITRGVERILNIVAVFFLMVGVFFGVVYALQ